MKRLGLMCCFAVAMHSALAQNSNRNIILITLDEFRWQELYSGADPILLLNKGATFWHPEVTVRRKLLMPFFWSEISRNGQLIGNRAFGNRVDCDNPHWFSYPGYNEMLTGFIDRRIKSNDKVDNPDMTVFEFISKLPGYENKVAAFATWDVFTNIFREGASHIPVSIGHKDDSTANLALRYMASEHPRAVFIGLDETDSRAHDGLYDQYLHAAHSCDEIIKQIWNFIQSDPQYKDNTTLIITTDHGRGRGYKHDKMNWRSHGRLAFGSGEVWIATLGVGVNPAGENTSRGKYTLSQVASTIASFLDVGYKNEKAVAPAIDCLLLERAAITSRKADNPGLD